MGFLFCLVIDIMKFSSFKAVSLFVAKLAIWHGGSKLDFGVRMIDQNETEKLTSLVKPFLMFHIFLDFSANCPSSYFYLFKLVRWGFL